MHNTRKNRERSKNLDENGKTGNPKLFIYSVHLIHGDQGFIKTTKFIGLIAWLLNRDKLTLS